MNNIQRIKTTLLFGRCFATHTNDISYNDDCKLTMKRRHARFRLDRPGGHDRRRLQRPDNELNL